MLPQYEKEDAFVNFINRILSTAVTIKIFFLGNDDQSCS